MVSGFLETRDNHIFAFIWMGSVNFCHAKNERRFGVDLTEDLVARAVQALFGPEQARQPIEDWMEELE